MKKVGRKRNYRLSKAVCPDGDKPVFEFPSAAMVKKMLLKNGALHTLIGFENLSEGGYGIYFNFILSNGTRSTRIDGDHKYYDHFIPADALNKIRSVTIHHLDFIRGFSFFDKNGALLWKHGSIHNDDKYDTVLLGENEVIAGVAAKLYYQKVYSDL